MIALLRATRDFIDLLVTVVNFSGVMVIEFLVESSFVDSILHGSKFDALSFLTWANFQESRDACVVLMW